MPQLDKAFMATIFFFMLLLSSGFLQAKDQLTLAYVDYAPLVYTNDATGEPEGELIDLISKHLEADFTIKWISFPIGRMQWGLLNGVIDATPFYIKTAEREKFADYFDKPYLIIQPLLCTLKEGVFSGGLSKSLHEALEGMKVISPLNSSYSYPFLSSEKIEHIKIPYAAYIERSFKLIVSEKADYVFLPTSPETDEELKKNNIACIKVGNQTGIYFAFSKQHPHKARVENIFESVEVLKR